MTSFDPTLLIPARPCRTRYYQPQHDGHLGDVGAAGGTLDAAERLFPAGGKIWIEHRDTDFDHWRDGPDRIASGKISAHDFFQAFLNWKSLVAIAVGVAVSWLGGRGVSLMSNQPSVVSGLLIGTVAGVALFRGVPVGPLIAAGLLSLLIGKS